LLDSYFRGKGLPAIIPGCSGQAGTRHVFEHFSDFSFFFVSTVSPLILQTERLIIRKFKPGDLTTALIDRFTDPEVMRYIGPRRALTEDESQKWLTDILPQQDKVLTRYAVALLETDELIGVAGLRDQEGIKDFGYYFRRKFWGTGYATEACAVILNHIENTLNIRDYQIFIADENVNSIRMIQRLGLQVGERITRSSEHGHLYKRVPG
jgi:RimJ/RimL family protein N-acetyltransferase